MYSEKDLEALSHSVSGRMSAKRFRHTHGVEEEAARMGVIYLPDRIPELRAAGLLHDMAKEMPIEEQIEVCRQNGDPELAQLENAPAIAHAHAASYLIPKLYPNYALPEIISSIYKHTTGAVEFSTFDKIIFLSDFIEPNRPYDESIRLRKAFWDEMPEEPKNRLLHLDRTVLSCLRYIQFFLTQKGIVPDPTTARAADALALKLQNQS